MLFLFSTTVSNFLLDIIFYRPEAGETFYLAVFQVSFNCLFSSSIVKFHFHCLLSVISVTNILHKFSFRYLIRRSHEDVCRLEMEFLRFDVESSSNCEYDYLAINGEKICGLIENTTSE